MSQHTAFQLIHFACFMSAVLYGDVFVVLAYIAGVVVATCLDETKEENK